MGLHVFRVQRSPCWLCLPSFQKTLAGYKFWRPPWGEPQLKLDGTDLSGPSLPTSWQTMKALVTWYLAQGKSVGEVIIPFENGVTIANVSLRHLKDNNKSTGNWVVVNITREINWPRFLRSLWMQPGASKSGKQNSATACLVCGSAGGLEALQELWSHSSLLGQNFSESTYVIPGYTWGRFILI